MGNDGREIVLFQEQPDGFLDGSDRGGEGNLLAPEGLARHGCSISATSVVRRGHPAASS